MGPRRYDVTPPAAESQDRPAIAHEPTIAPLVAHQRTVAAAVPPTTIPAPLPRHSSMDSGEAPAPDGPGVNFPAGNDDFRAARNRCAAACRRFNETPEDATADVRSMRWLE